MRDFGYDVADYCGVDPVFGTLADFDAVVQRAHGLGLKVIIDQVYSHTSDQHPWFKESRANREESKADWYVWADAKPDGSPPNNWQSVFGGPAWTWDARRGQYYLHNFLPEQPDLNVHNVRRAGCAAGRGAVLARPRRRRLPDRCDQLSRCMTLQLRDNPPAANGKKRTRPFDFQQHLYNQSHPDILKFLERLRAKSRTSYGDRFTLAEVGGDHALDEMRAFTTASGRLNSAYGFDFLYAEQLTPELVARVANDWPDTAGWPTWAFENHDAPRAISRWVDDATSGPFRADENAAARHIARHRSSFIRARNWACRKSTFRSTGCRIPKRSPTGRRRSAATARARRCRGDSNARQLGFSDAEPWLPVGESTAQLAIDRQDARSDSLLQFTRECLEAAPRARSAS